MIGKIVGSLFKNAPAPPGVVAASHEAEVESEDAQTARALDALRSEVRRAGAQLPALISSQLRQVDDVLRTVVAAVADQGASTEQRVLLSAIICSYIPTPLHAFLALSDKERGADSRGTQLLAEQLTTLEAISRDLLNQVRVGAIAELSTHGRFLNDKFAPSSLTLDGR
ncbi:hypothetical protein IV498_01575 [Paenarthrobacter sp. Z7-10]|uniref:hypothetical protein n=1 Tax=Paenarthrobacter sp. Z7-10 TaxID=2787635 RepID=UPI0022A978B7|nr:hypothetical protein [Paenarthrobacter sp. Z7-10]MCZ2401905.1 hypothetical protein [Paenarthrobacter sp. Z7-10]